MNSWHRVRIRDIAVTYDGPHATPRSTKTATSGPVFLGISSLQDGRLDLAQSAHLSEDDVAQWTRRVTPQPGDVVFSYETRLGQAAMIPADLRCSLGRRLALMRPDRTKVDPRFLLYAYLGPRFQEEVRKRTIHGSTVNRTSLGDSPDFPIDLPSLPEQQGIAVTLGALDCKVELNRRTIKLARRATGTSGSHQRLRPRDAMSIEVPDVRRLPEPVVAEAQVLLLLTHQKKVESQRLADLRDALLPKLMSGRIRVPEAREAVEAAV